MSYQIQTRVFVRREIVHFYGGVLSDEDQFVVVD